MTTAACIQPGAVAPADFMAYVDGEAPTPVATHVRACPSCAAEAQALARAQHRLRSALHRFDCPSSQTLGEYELGLLAPEARSGVARHLLDCPRCAEELRTLRVFLALPDPAPAPVLVDRLAQAAAALRRVVATLVPSPPGLAHAGLRGAATAGVRTYRAGDVTMTVSTAPSGSGAAGRGILISGLVVRGGATHESVELAAGGQARLTPADPAAGSQQVAIDEFGNFSFEAVAAGVYQLEVQLADHIVVVEGLDVHR